MNILNIHIFGFIFYYIYKYINLFVLINYKKIIHKYKLDIKNIQLRI